MIIERLEFLISKDALIQAYMEETLVEFIPVLREFAEKKKYGEITIKLEAGKFAEMVEIRKKRPKMMS